MLLKRQCLIFGERAINRVEVFEAVGLVECVGPEGVAWPLVCPSIAYVSIREDR